MATGGPAHTDGTFEQDFGDLWAIAYRVAHRLLPEPADAEDATAEALARLHASWSRVGGRPWRDGWLVRVTTNVAIDQIRRDARLLRVPAPELASSRQDDAVLTRLALLEALRRLPRRQREVVVLRHLAGYPEATVADQLRVSTGAVKRHSHRALAALRGLLEVPSGETREAVR